MQKLKKAKNFIFSHLNLAIFYEAIMLYVVMPFYFQTFSSRAYQYLSYVWWIWTILIFAHDFLTRKVPKDSLIISLLIFFAAACLSYIFVPQGQHGLAELGNLINLGMMVYVFTSIPLLYSKKEVDRTFNILAIQAIAVISIYNLLSVIMYIMWKNGAQTFFGIDLTQFVNIRSSGEIRFFGLHSHPIMASGRSMLCMILCLYLMDKYFNLKRWMKILLSISCVLAVVMIILCGSRFSAVEGLMAMIYILLHYVSHLKHSRIIYILVAAVVIIGIAVEWSKFSSLFYYIAHPSESPMDQERFQWWGMALEAFKEKPVLGWGWYSSHVIESSNVHNAFMNILSWTGLAGIIPFIISIIISFIKIIRNRYLIQKYRIGWLLVLIACIFAESMVEPELIGVANRVPTMFFWFSLGYVCFIDKMNAADVIL